MGERLLCKQEVDGSIPFTSTSAGTNAGADGPTPESRVAGRGPSAMRADPGPMVFDIVKRNCAAPRVVSLDLRGRSVGA